MADLNTEDFDPELLERCMNRCITLAYKGLPQMRKPLVGAVVLDEAGKIIGEGYRSLLGGTKLAIHAERMALNHAEDRARGGILITTLEPCIPARGSQLLQSCGDYIARVGIATVIVGCLDSSATVHSEKGIHYLQNQGVRVVRYEGMRGILEGLVV